MRTSHGSVWSTSRRAAIVLVMALVSAVSTAAPSPAADEPTLVLTPASGPPGSAVDAAATGLPPDYRADVRLDDPERGPLLAADVPITAKGTFAVAFVVPRGVALGDHIVHVCVRSGAGGRATCDRMPSARFVVTAPPTTSTTAGPATTRPGVETTAATRPTTTTTSPTPTVGLGEETDCPTAGPSPGDETDCDGSGPGGLAGSTPTPTVPPVGQLAGPTTTHGSGLGELTGSSALPDLEITGMEITQGIQNLDNDMPLVAGRTTVLRVYVRTDGPALPQVSGLLQLVRHNSEEVAVIEPDNGPLTVDGDAPDRLDVDGSLNFTLPPTATDATSQGDRLIATAFVFSTHPSTPAEQEPTDANNFEAGVFDLHTTGDLTVHLLPMHMHEAPHPGAADATYGTSATDFLAAAATITSLYRYHPVSGVNAVMGPTIYPPLHGLQLDWLPAAMTEWDLTLDGVEASVLGQVEDVWAETSTTSHLDQYYGIYREDLPRVWGGFSNGTVAYGYYDLTFGSEHPWYHRAGWLAAHELGHSIGFAHVGCKGTEGNPGPYPWSDPCSLAPVDPAGYYGWDIRHDAFAVTGGPTVISQAPGLHPHNGYPYMGYQSSKWTDPWHYCRALVKLGVDCTAVAIPENEIGPTDGPDLTATAPYQPSVDHDGWIEIHAVSHEIHSPPDAGSPADDHDPLTAARFTITLDGVQTVAEPLPHVLAAMADRRRRGEPSGVTAAVVDGAGTVLAEVELVETMEGADPVQPEPADLEPADAAPVVTAMTDYLPWFDEAVAVQLLVDGEVVDERRATAHAPSVEIVRPAGGPLGLPLTIEWRAEDEDGDDLAFHIAYSPDAGATWFAVASYVGGSSYTVKDASALAGGEQAIVRVTATDGLLATSATSAPGVLDDQPPQVLVLSPGEAETVPLHGSVTLLASAFDREDREASTVTWSSDRDGPLGTGAHLVTQALSAGEHVLTATATDRAGHEATAAVQVLVDADTALDRLDEDGFETGVRALREGPVTLADLRPASSSGSGFAWVAGLLTVLALAAAGVAVRRGRAAGGPSDP